MSVHTICTKVVEQTQRIHSLIQAGESQTLEFKLSFGREAMETLSLLSSFKPGDRGF